MCLCNMPLPMSRWLGEPGPNLSNPIPLSNEMVLKTVGGHGFIVAVVFYPTSGISPLFVKGLLNTLNIASIGTKEINSILTWTFFIAEPTMSLSPLFLLHRCFSFERGKMRMLLLTNDQRLMKQMHLVYAFPVVLWNFYVSDFAPNI